MELPSVPPELSRLSRLTELSLRGNEQLEGGLEALSHLSSLVSLNIDQGRLGNAGLDVALPTTLDALDLAGSSLTAVPATLAALTGLKVLDLGYNRLSGGWQHLAGMRQLAYLSVYGCGLEGSEG